MADVICCIARRLQCTHRAPTMLPPCTNHASTVRPSRIHYAPTVHPPCTYPPCIHLAPTVHPPCTHRAPTVHTQHINAMTINDCDHSISESTLLSAHYENCRSLHISQLFWFVCGWTQSINNCRQINRSLSSPFPVIEWIQNTISVG